MEEHRNVVYNASIRCQIRGLLKSSQERKMLIHGGVDQAGNKLDENHFDYQ
jgi:hypothetical protein